jgi:small subunit ribosomal protein S21
LETHAKPGAFQVVSNSMKVIVYDNQIEKAIRDLKRKLSKEGFYSEIKERRFYDKPSVQKKKKQAKAAKRLRKKMRRF